MVSYCSVVGCKNNQNIKGLKFFRFPKVGKNLLSKERRMLRLSQRKAWFHSLSRQDLKLCDLDTRTICSAHFISGKPAKECDTSDPDWKPSVNMGRKEMNIAESKECESSNMNSRGNRYNRRLAKEVVDSIISLSLGNNISNSSLESTSISVSDNEQEAISNGHSRVDDNVDNGLHESLVDSQNNSNNLDVWAELQKRTEEVFLLRKQIKQLELTEEAFVGNDEKLKFYTGLNAEVFQLIRYTLNDSLNSLRCGKLDNFQKLLITLMKLRLNASYKDLAYRFSVRPDTVSNIFKKMIVILYHAFNEFIMWPNRNAAKVLMPSCFQQNFGNSVTVIIDCFEIATQKPSTLQAKVQTFSNYKQKTTVKYLIGITPHGTISFISKGYGGRVSDQAITTDCGILENLLPGDIIMADRGFNINEVAAERRAEAKIPNSTRGRSQLHPKAVENTRSIAAVRIHIERIIGEIQNKYAIMNGPIQINLLRNKYENQRLLDYIVRVCCILINFCDSIVPVDK